MSGCTSLGVTAAMLVLIYLMVRAFTAPKTGGNGAAGPAGAGGGGATQSWGTDPKTGRQITVQVKGDSQWQWATISLPMAKPMPPGLIVGVRPSPRIALAPGASDERAFYALADAMGKSPERVTDWAIPENRDAVLEAYWKLKQGFQIRGTTISANVPVSGTQDPEIQRSVYILAELAQRLSAVADTVPAYGAVQGEPEENDERYGDELDVRDEESAPARSAAGSSTPPFEEPAPAVQATSPTWNTPAAITSLPPATPSPFAASGTPGAAAALSPFAASSAPGAAAVLSPFAASSAPGAAAALSPFAASGTPGATAALSPFAASGTPGATAALSPFATSGTPGATAALSPFATSGTPGATAAPSPFAASSTPGAAAAPSPFAASVPALATPDGLASSAAPSAGAPSSSRGGAASASDLLAAVVQQPSSEAQEKLVTETWAGRLVGGEGKVSFHSSIFGRDSELDVTGGLKVTVEVPVQGAGLLGPKVVIHLPEAPPPGVLGFGKTVRFEGEVKGYRGLGRNLLLLNGRLL